MTYNGWTNYETWLANMYLSGSEEWIETLIVDNYDGEAVDIDMIGENLSDSFDDLYGSQTPDTGFVADIYRTGFSRINWYEIAETYVSEYTSSPERLTGGRK